LRDLGRPAEALASYQAALLARPDFPEALNALGCLLTDLRRLDEAAAALTEAIRLRPDFAIAHSNLGNVLSDQGLLEASLACDDRAIALQPRDPRFHSNRVYSLNFHPAFDAMALLREQVAWDDQHGRFPQECSRPHNQDRAPDRRLRIGYVSPDFRAHAVGRNVLPLFREHDHGVVEVFCYSDVTKPDYITAQFRKYADGWRDIAGWSHARLADQVRADRIDILVDLTLHMANNRLPAFARKPAPIQVTFGGYPGGTGLRTMDYRLTDPYLDPPGLSDAHYVERSIRLPHSFWCYDVASMSMGLGFEPSVNPLPALASGCITFGCLSNFCKINVPVLTLWARVLSAVPSSRLLVLAPEGSHRQRLLDLVGHHGIEPGRVEFVMGRPWLQYLEYYHRIDIGLDTFPYNGHTTSLEACRMGVPVVTRTGDTAASRAGLSLFSNLGLTGLVASGDDQFVAIAQALATDLPRLATLRAELRGRIQASPLMDAPLFARSIESAYRAMWHRACSTQEP
jgi:predicted O-linked N-acetylglucosamine transferase (SPINDLY family)